MSDDASDSDDDWFEDAISDDDGDVTNGDAGDAADEGTDDAPGRGGDADDISGSDTGTDDTEDALDDTGPADEGADAAFGSAGSADDTGSPFDDGPGSAPGETSGPDDGDLFEEDFASAFGSAGGEASDFEQDDSESDIPRLDIGIEGLDGMIQGGVPRRHLIVTIGSAGTGKTTFALQFLHQGLQQGENAVFITLEQSHDSIIDTANERGWNFDEYEADDQLAVVDLDPVEMANSLDNIRGELPSLIEQFDADRFVLDSVSLLEMMYDDQARRRTEVFDFTRSLKRAGVTTLLTSEADEENPYNSRYGIIEYLTDAVFVLQYVRSGTEETRLAVEIQKIRNANHSRETKPYEITGSGISVFQQAGIF